MVLLAAYGALLHRVCGEDDVPVGTAVANRHRVEVENLVGFFVNTLVLRLRPHGGLELAELLRQARELTLEAQAHQDVPFEKLVEDLQPERSLAHTPLFQVMLVIYYPAYTARDRR